MNSLGAHRESLRRAVERAHEGRTPVQCVGGGHAPRVASRRILRAPAGILDFWPEDLVVRAGAATTFADLDEFLSSWGFDLGIVVGEADQHTLGGAYARGCAGMTSESLRERALSALVVDGRGTPLELGARVVKNVAGYDLLRLHFGAGGSLGAISDLLLRVRAKPPATMSRWRLVEAGRAVDVLLDARRSTSSSTVGEYYLGRELVERWGGDAAGAWMFSAEGGARELEVWGESLGGVRLKSGPGELDGFGMDTTASILIVDHHVSTRLALSAQPLLDAITRWWWLDAGRGLLRCALDGDRLSELRRSLNAPAYRVRGECVPALERPSTATDTWMRRLRRAWDPAGIFPEPEGPVS